MTTILSRSNWTTTRASGTPFTWSRIRGLVCHYPAAGRDIGVISKSQEESRIRGWRNYHVNGRGWADLGYNYVITQAGRIYTGRGNRVGAHCAGHNSTTIGVLFMVGDNEPLTAAAKKSFKSLRAYLRGRGAGSGVWGHQQMSGASTRCPGPYIMADIRDGSLKAGTGGGAAKPGSGGSSGGGGSTYKVVSKTADLGLYDKDGNGHTRIKDWQTDALGYDEKAADGYFGPDTRDDTKDLQKQIGLKGKDVDGMVGPTTLTAWEKAGKPKLKKAAPSKPKPPKSKVKQITVDGKWGRDTTRRLQEELGTPVDGEVSFQPVAFKSQNPGLLSGWEWTKNPRSSNVIEALQGKLGVTPDGRIGPDTIRGLQRKLGTGIDGKVSNPSAMVKQLQENLNAGKLW